MRTSPSAFKKGNNVNTIITSILKIMEPLTIHVEVNLGEKTLGILQNLLQPNTTRAAAPAAPAKPASAAPTQDPAPAKGTKPEDEGDMPGPISDEELRAAVKSAKDATSAADVKAIFAEFGIKTSSDCPEDRRYDLLKKLVNLSSRK